MHIPVAIKRCIGDQKGILDSVGCSNAQVMMFDDMVLKMQPVSNAAMNEHHMMRWLQGRLPVPRIIKEAFAHDACCLLMSRMPGTNLLAMLDDQDRLACLVAEGLQRMWRTDVRGCPTDRSLTQKFQEIEQGIRLGTITMDNARQEETYGPSGFTSPSQFLDWLVKHRPAEELVFSHGDYCLPNIFCDENGLTGFIDLGYAGVADKWVDIEKVLWSMWANTTGQFGGKQRPFDRSKLFNALGMSPDEEKLRYYSLLSELC